MSATEMVLAIEDEDGPVCECTADQFVADNGDGLSDEECADVAHLIVGESLSFGGGASPVLRVRRVA